MANGNRGSVVEDRRAAAPRRTLRSDPTLPRTLVDLVFDSGDGGTARRPRRRGERQLPLLPRRLPLPIASELSPNILYRRYPLVTSLLVELDELRRVGVLPPTRRR